MEDLDMKPSVFERHAQTVLSGAALLLLGWVGYSVSEQGRSIAVLTERVASLTRQIEEMHNKPFLLRSDFALMTAPMYDRVSRNEENIKEMKQCIEGMKADLYIKYPNPRKIIE